MFPSLSPTVLSPTVRSSTGVALRGGLAVAASAALLATLGADEAHAHESIDEAAPVTSSTVPAPEQPRGGPAESVIHIVEQGESLAEIATEYGYEADDAWRRIFDANPEIENPDLIFVDLELRVPAADETLEARDLPLPPPPAVVESSRSSARGSRSGSAAGRTQTAAPQAAAPQAAAPSVAGAGVWDRLAACESGGNWSINTGNGYSGGLQFHPGTWAAFGGTAYAPSAHLATKSQQIEIAQRVQAGQGWGAWPACSRKIGLR
jgi:hypothetical protein